MDASKLNFNQKLTILVNLFIKKELSINWVSVDWGRERGALKILLLKYPDFDFFYSLQDLYGKFNSLLGISDKYIKGLTIRYEDFVIEKSRKVEYKLEEKPVIKIEAAPIKFKNMLEFLDN